MDNNTFDSQLKSALENLEAPFDPAAWSAFEQRLPAPPPAPVDAVDQAVRRALEQLETSYQPAHWEQFASQLTRIEQLRRRVWISKSAEAAILLLLLLLANAYGFFGFEPYRSVPQDAPVQNQPIATSDKAGSGQHTPAVHNPAGVDGRIPNNGTSFFVPLDATQRTVNQKIAAAGVVSDRSLTPTEMASAMISMVGQNSVENSAVMLPFDPLSTVDFLTLPLSNLLHPLKEVTPKAPMASHFYAVTYASLDKNQVRIGSETRPAQGYGGGLAVGYRPGKWGLEAGVAFSQKNYTPLKQVEIYDNTAGQGHFRSFAREVDADIVSIPVKATRRLAHFGKTSAHAVAGVTANMAIEKSYRHKKTFYSDPAPIGTIPINQADELRQSGQGVLEGGQFMDNAYVTADLGLRVEHSLGKRLVAFVEPSYQFSVAGQGIGPKPAKINTVGIHAGVMASL